MTNRSNTLGRAFEFACIHSLYDEIDLFRPVTIISNDAYFQCESCWNAISSVEQSNLTSSAITGAKTILDLEPLIKDPSSLTLTLEIQNDGQGVLGDVRDIVISRDEIQWEIGLSVKHNHFAVKHSRLSRVLDFGQRWYGIPCSQTYWDDIKPLFDWLAIEKANNTMWRDLPNKDLDVYVPLLNAFRNEIVYQCNINPDLPRLLVEYLLGQFDFYKVVGLDRQQATQIQSFNLRGTLNQEGNHFFRTEILPVAELPTRLIELEFKPSSTNTLEMYLDNGWTFSFRIHNASSRVDTSLKFDIQIIGMPVDIVTFNIRWI